MYIFTHWKLKKKRLGLLAPHVRSDRCIIRVGIPGLKQRSLDCVKRVDVAVECCLAAEETHFLRQH